MRTMPHGAQQPLLQVVPGGKGRKHRLRHVDHHAEQNGGGELQQLEPLVLFAQNPDLDQHKNEIHNNSGGTHGQPGDPGGHIGDAGNGRRPQRRLDGKRHAEGHDDESRTQNASRRTGWVHRFPADSVMSLSSSLRFEIAW